MWKSCWGLWIERRRMMTSLSSLSFYKRRVKEILLLLCVEICTTEFCKPCFALKKLQVCSFNILLNIGSVKKHIFAALWDIRHIGEMKFQGIETFILEFYILWKCLVDTLNCLSYLCISVHGVRHPAAWLHLVWIESPKLEFFLEQRSANVGGVVKFPSPGIVKCYYCCEEIEYGIVYVMV